MKKASEIFDDSLKKTFESTVEEVKKEDEEIGEDDLDLIEHYSETWTALKDR